MSNPSITFFTCSCMREAIALGGRWAEDQPWLPWPSPAIAPAGCPPPSPSRAAGWSRWCLALRWGCAWYSCRWRSLQPERDRGAQRQQSRSGCRHADSLAHPPKVFCKHISLNSFPCSLWNHLALFPTSTLSGYWASRLGEMCLWRPHSAWNLKHTLLPLSVLKARRQRFSKRWKWRRWEQNQWILKSLFS